MNVKIFSTGCSKCNVLISKITQSGIPFELIEDLKLVEEEALKHNISMAPFMLVDDKVYDFVGAVNWIKENESCK